MNENVTDVEQRILLSVFEGNHPSFNVLAKQMSSLRVRERIKEYHTYQVFFSVDGLTELRLKGPEENIQIEGTLLSINEANATLYVSLQIKDGFIDWLLIGGDYQFENDFTINKVFWENRNDNPHQEGELVYSAIERDFKKAIGYTPVYK